MVFFCFCNYVFNVYTERWLDNIRMDIVEVGWGDVDWISLAQDRDRWRAREFGIEPSSSIRCWETIECPNN
jgi:hypothetical protein